MRRPAAPVGGGVQPRPVGLAAGAVDAGHAQPAADSGLVKYTVTNNAIRAVEIALQLSGNHGLTRHNPLERHYRDVLCSRIHTPQNDAILVVAGKRAIAKTE